MLFCPVEFLFSYALGVGQPEMPSDKETSSFKDTMNSQKSWIHISIPVLLAVSQGPVMLMVWQHCTPKLYVFCLLAVPLAGRSFL